MPRLKHEERETHMRSSAKYRQPGNSHISKDDHFAVLQIDCLRPRVEAAVGSHEVA